MENRIKKINQLITGWVQYYKYANMKNHMKKIDSWVRRKLRAIRWKEWKTPKNRRKNLIKLGMNRKEAYIYSNTRKSYWRISKSWILNKNLTNQHWISQGFKSFSNYYNAVKIQS
jgi:hypothetical protein